MADLKDIGMACPTAPERIWLQCDPEPEEDGKPIYPANPAQDDVTWCADQINASDTLYIRADVARPRRLRRDEVIDLISPLSKNSADHDIEFAQRVMDALGVRVPDTNQGD